MPAGRGIAVASISARHSSLRDGVQREHDVKMARRAVLRPGRGPPGTEIALVGHGHEFVAALEPEDDLGCAWQ